MGLVELIEPKKTVKGTEFVDCGEDWVQFEGMDMDARIECKVLYHKGTKRFCELGDGITGIQKSRGFGEYLALTEYSEVRASGLVRPINLVLEIKNSHLKEGTTEYEFIVPSRRSQDTIKRYLRNSEEANDHDEEMSFCND